MDSSEFVIDLKNISRQRGLVDDYVEMKSDWAEILGNDILNINHEFDEVPREERSILESDPILKLRDLDIGLCSTLYRCNYKNDEQKKRYLAYRVYSIHYYNLVYHKTKDHLTAAIDTLNYLGNNKVFDLEELDYFVEFIFLPQHLPRASRLFVLLVMKLTGKIETITPDMIDQIDLELANRDIPVRFLKHTVLKDAVYAKDGDYIREILLTNLPFIEDITIVEQNLRYANQLPLQDYHHVTEEDIFKLLPEQVRIKKKPLEKVKEDLPIKAISSRMTIKIRTRNVKRLTIITWYILNMALDYTDVKMDTEVEEEIMTGRYPIPTDFQNQDIVFRIGPEDIRSEDGELYTTQFHLVNVHPRYFNKVRTNLKMVRKLMPNLFAEFRMYPASLTLLLGPDPVLERLYHAAALVVGDEFAYIPSDYFAKERDKKKPRIHLRKGGYIQATYFERVLDSIGLKIVVHHYDTLQQKLGELLIDAIRDWNYRLQDEELLSDVTNLVESLLS